ncbi:hypothetical protein ENU1_093250 [Entamoeba nuttalli P19]|uniref:Uncharacterized protein n=2 Tax=Entamoeba nuttalli TaxID=412467 RepID=K2H235_ENTNP|nr:hypothetical protein ENU1_093250 [Entamoeba nuttalli P19]EKE40347.1 hypothetical protein ENU1_093250 [Entamoeba nuttalli P19]|eukprot:XP_008857317.1 hypothetical protein ENU1_093250 [Entamoeba nuttalli P19]
MSGRRSIGRRKHQARYQSVYSKKGKIKEEEDDEYEDTSISVNSENEEINMEEMQEELHHKYPTNRRLTRSIAPIKLKKPKKGNEDTDTSFIGDEETPKKVNKRTKRKYTRRIKKENEYDKTLINTEEKEEKMEEDKDVVELIDDPILQSSMNEISGSNEEKIRQKVEELNDITLVKTAEKINVPVNNNIIDLRTQNSYLIVSKEQAERMFNFTPVHIRKGKYRFPGTDLWYNTIEEYKKLQKEYRTNEVV